MDIITQGDFAISSDNGNTVISFAIPSQIPIDFEQYGLFIGLITKKDFYNKMPYSCHKTEIGHFIIF